MDIVMRRFGRPAW